MSKNQVYPSSNNAKEKLIKDSDQENQSHNASNNQQNLQVTHPDAVKPSQVGDRNLSVNEIFFRRFE